MTPELAAVLQVEPLNANSAISVGLMLTILTASIYLSRSLTRTEEQLRQINEKLKDLGKLPDRVQTVEKTLSNLEADINNLWEAFREIRPRAGDTMGNTRSERGIYRRDIKGE